MEPVPHLLLLIIGCAGSTLIITSSKLFSYIRKISPFPLNCPMCTGFWVGLLISIATLPLHNLNDYIECFLIGSTVSLISTFVKFLFDKTNM